MKENSYGPSISQHPQVSWQVPCPCSSGMLPLWPMQGQGAWVRTRAEADGESTACHILLLLTKPQVTHQTPSLTVPGQPGKKGAVYAEHWSERFTSRGDELTQQWEAGPTAASKTPLSLACCKEQWICDRGGLSSWGKVLLTPLKFRGW